MTTKHAHAAPTRVDEPSPRARRTFGAFVMLLGLLSVGYFEYQARSSRSCIEEKVTALTVAVEARGDLITKANRATQLVTLKVAASRSMPPAEARRTVDQALIDYTVSIDEIEKERQEKPLPAFPAGACR